MTAAAALASWVDGRPGCALPLPDRGLEYGDGLYETLAVDGGRLRLLDRHLARLVAGCARLRIAVPDPVSLAAELAAAAAVPGTGVVKLIVTRGAGGRGYVIDAAAPARRIVQAWPARPRPAAWATAGARARLCRLRLAEQPALAGLKHLNRLEQVLARAEWDDPDVAEGLLRDVQGRLVCGTMSNVYAALPEALVTPAVERCGVAGVARAAALDWLRATGTPVAVRDLRVEELARAREAFVTNALIGAWPLRELADADGRVLHRWEPGAICRALQRRYAAAWGPDPGAHA